jgi:hypothetical protein
MPRVEVDAIEDALTTVEDVAEAGLVHEDVIQYWYKKSEMKKLASDPEYLLQYRKKIEFAINSGFALFYKGSDASKMAQEYMTNEMKRRLKNHPTLTKKLIPSWAPGCRLVSYKLCLQWPIIRFPF